MLSSNEALAALDPSSPVLPKLQQASQDIQQLSSELNRVLVELPFPDNWDAARAALEQASEIGRETVSPILSGELAQQVRAAAMQGGQTTQETAQLTTQVVLVSALFIVIIGAGIAFYVDRYMAETGDLLITEIAERVKRIAAELLESPKLYRLEAAEFAILTPFESHEDAQTTSAALSQRLLQGFDTPLEVNQANYVVSLSIGYIVRESDTCDAVDMIRDSHAALMQAADGGGGSSLRFTDALADRAMRAVQLEAALHGAIDRGELSVHYQPQVTANNTSLCGAEALVRWQSPEFGVVSPGEFIPLAESSGLIRKIGDWVAKQAFLQAAAWNSSESANIQVAINVSAQQLLDPTFPPRIQQLLDETGVPPALIELEITESAVMGNMRQAISAMKQLKAMGIDLAIDDFGTGYSSLSYLQDFPTDKLKIDQSFVRNLNTSSADQAIVITMITLSKNLGMRVLSEGVETEAQLDILKSLGCDEIQGYLTGKPRLAEETLLDFQDGRWKG